MPAWLPTQRDTTRYTRPGEERPLWPQAHPVGPGVVRAGSIEGAPEAMSSGRVASSLWRPL
jgi:hypothetical protein